ncbi:MAG: ATP-binding cassette domain-containing protein [Deltaproteobacteria bacterium]
MSIDMSIDVINAELDKSYPNCRVLVGAKLAVKAGTVHALVGENGAGKSTLVKILAGIVPADRGSLEVGGARVDLAAWDRRAARRAHISIVQQHGAFAGSLSVVENAVLGAEPTKRGLLDLRPTAAALAELGDKLGLAVEPWARVDRLSLGAAQRAEIVTALHAGAKLLILDEPTAVLAPVEVEGLLRMMRELAKAGTAIVFVTHKLDEVRAVADSVTVLRAGQTVATFDQLGGEVDVHAIAKAMVGGELPAQSSIPSPAPDAKVALALRGVSVAGDIAAAPGPGLATHAAGGRAVQEVAVALRKGSTKPAPDPRAHVLEAIDLTVRAGEILGVAGVDGNGQRELALAIAGLAPYAGTISLAGRDLAGRTPHERLAAGLAHVPEDRQRGGLVLDASVADNLALGRTDITGRFRIDRAAVARFADARIAELDIRPASRDAVARSLSGGNQQKIVIGRELSRPSLAAVIAAQPTRGVDLGAVARIHDQLRAAASAGAGVLVISADLDELLALCHRVVVMLRGRIVGERAGAELRAEGARAALGEWMTGSAA